MCPMLMRNWPRYSRGEFELAVTARPFLIATVLRTPARSIINVPVAGSCPRLPAAFGGLEPLDELGPPVAHRLLSRTFDLGTRLAKGRNSRRNRKARQGRRCRLYGSSMGTRGEKFSC